MNDFTKEELNSLKDVYLHTWNRFVNIGCDKKGMLDIVIKLQSLIDNYCEHETQPVFTTDGCVIPVCMKCGKCTK